MQIVKILSLAATILLATSCSKENTRENKNSGVADFENTLEVPFSIKVETGSKKLSKISCTDDGSSVTTVFTQKDIDNKVKMVVTGDGIVSGDLFLTNIDGTFSGTLVFEDEDWKEGILGGFDELTATVVVNEGATKKCSLTSLEDLIENCEHIYRVTSADDDEVTPFYYGEKTLYLYDNNAYFEFNVAEGQYKVNVNDEWYPAGDNTIDQSLKQIWVAVPVISETDVTTIVRTRFRKESKDAYAGRIYTVNSTDAVDMGLSVLWRTSNTIVDGNEHFTFAEATEVAAGVSGYDLPTADDFRELTGEKTIEGITVGKAWKGNGSNGAVNVNDNGCTFSTDYGSVFFPNAGTSGYNRAGHMGYYWSKTKYNEENVYDLYIALPSSAFVSSVMVSDRFAVRLVK